MPTPPEILFSCGNETAALITPEDMPDLQALLERSADFFYLIEGQPPGPDAARSLEIEGPPGWSLKKKILIGVKDQNSSLIAIIEGMRDYPEDGIFWIGLLLIDPFKRSQGLGERIMNGFEGWARAQGARQVRLGVADVNRKAMRFWQRIGFELVSKTGPTFLGQNEHVIYRMKKIIK